MQNSEIKTPQTHPSHPVVGHYYKGTYGKIYYCDSYDPRIGYWMQDIHDPSYRTNVSERAIDRTFHKIDVVTFLCRHRSQPETTDRLSLWRAWREDGGFSFVKNDGRSSRGDRLTWLPADDFEREFVRAHI